MRDLVDAARVRRFMESLGQERSAEGRLYFTGGASAVLLGWRTTTIDLDIKLVGADDAVLRMLPDLKERLRINVELASPDHFIPELPGWQDRSVFIEQLGRLAFFHYDFYAQALAKIERSHEHDLEDVREMIARGYVDPKRGLELFAAIEPALHRYPAINPRVFRRNVETILKPA
jgi:uncharacterized nucleotidyltransferase DUF6036